MLIKILGIGSPFGDDQVGWKVIEALKKSLSTHMDIQLAALDRPGVGLIEWMQGCDKVYLIDAVQSGQAVGTIHRLVGEDIQAFKTGYSTHHMGIAEALALAEVLNDKPVQVVFYGIEIDQIVLDGRLSEPALNAIQQVALHIQEEIYSNESR